MAASSSSHQEIMEYQQKMQRSTAQSKLYDAFISHRGPDVKETLAKQLYEVLEDGGYRAFLDCLELEKGDSITPAIESAIRSSDVQMAIFSKGYAESAWCLDELVLMLRQQDDEGSLFIPVFYHVKPTDLRYIMKGAYATAFREHESKGRNLNKLDGWKEALRSASNVVGFEFGSSENKLCKDIASRVKKEIERRRPLDVASYPVGLGELVRDFESSFEEPVKIVGIFGLGGSGKTTLAKALFNKKSSQYNASCFIYDVRESHVKRELHVLQRQLLKDLFSENGEFQHTEKGTPLLKDRLKKAKSSCFLIILDDIDHQDQLHALLFQDLLSPGSLVILTTRDEGVLMGAGISNRYKMKTMDDDRAKKLFCSHAFGGKEPAFLCDQLVECFVEFCGGLPLSLKVLGTHVSGRDEKYWKLELEKVKEVQPNDVRQCLKISFDSLEREEKQIFMDIACFFIGKEKDRAVEMWKATQWTTAEHAVQRLLDKCLVEVEDYCWRGPDFRMHNHLRDFGREMADEEVPRRLWQQEHLMSMRKRGFQKILEETNGRSYGELRDWRLGFEIEYLIENSNNYAGASTAFLWLGPVKLCSGERIPPWFPVRLLRDLYAEKVDELWSIPPGRIDTQDSFQLRRLNLQSCSGLQTLPDLLKILYHLEELIINDYLFQSDTELTALLKSIANLSNLKILEISNFRKNMLSPNLSCLETSEISDVPVNGDSPNLSELETSEISVVPVNGEPFLLKLGSPETLEISDVPNGRLFLQKLSSLETLKIENMPVNGEFLSNRGLTHFSCMSKLRKVSFDSVYFPKLVISGEVCPSLEYLQISDVDELTEVDLKLVKTLKVLSLEYCGNLKTISGLSDQTSLEELSICHGSESENIEAVQELEGLKYLEILGGAYNHIPAGRLNFISGLKRLPSERIIIARECASESEAVRRLNVNLFSDVISGHAITQFQSRRDYCLKLEEIRTSSTAIIVCAFHISKGLDYFMGQVRGTSQIGCYLYRMYDRITTVVSAGQVIEVYGEPKILKGFMASVNRDEEWKALRLLKVIIDHLSRP